MGRLRIFPIFPPFRIGERIPGNFSFYPVEMLSKFSF
jgi:hypothetical protein